MSEDRFVQLVMNRIAAYEDARAARRELWLGWCPPALACIMLAVAALLPLHDGPRPTAALAWVSAESGAPAQPVDPEFDTLALLALE